MNVLILSGTSFVAFIRVADKGLPSTSYLTESQKNDFANEKVFHLIPEKVFSPPEGKLFHFVFNTAIDLKYGQPEQIYSERIVQVATLSASLTLKLGIPFVHLSTAQVYEGVQKASDESSKLKPWTSLATAHLQAETELQKISGLKLVILRPSYIYGLGDFANLTPRFIIGAVYSHLGEEMKLLWTKDLKINTVHVRDVVRAMWSVVALEDMGGYRKSSLDGIEIYNLSDKSDSDQGSINEIITKIFGVTTGFQGNIVSQFAKLNLDSVTEDVNDKHLEPWSKLCVAAGISSTPLTPYLDKEVLKDNAMSIDGGKAIGFKYEIPTITEEKVREIIDAYVEMGIWPKGTLKK